MNPERRDNESKTSNRPSEASDPARKTLPPAWRTIVSSAPASTWFQFISASGRQLIQDAQTSQLHIISPHLQLQQTPPEPVYNPGPGQVISWDPSRPSRGPAHQPAQLGSLLYLQDQLWGPHHLSHGVWGWGSPAVQTCCSGQLRLSANPSSGLYTSYRWFINLKLCLQRWQTSPLPLGLCALTHTHAASSAVVDAPGLL